MIAEAQNLVPHIGNVAVQITRVRSVAGVGLEELIPNQNAVLVAQLVEVFARALSYPVANQVEVGQLVQANLGLQTLARNALEPLVQSPVAAANEDRHAVDGDGQRLGAGNAVAD